MNVRIGLVFSLFVVACGGSQPEAKPATAAPAEPKAATTSIETPETAKVADAPKAADAPKPIAEPPITSVRVYVSNECDKPVAYCVEDGSTLNTSLSQRTSTTHTVKPGAKILEKTGSSCGSAKLTVPASKDEVKFSICKK